MSDSDDDSEEDDEDEEEEEEEAPPGVPLTMKMLQNGTVQDDDDDEDYEDEDGEEDESSEEESSEEEEGEEEEELDVIPLPSVPTGEKRKAALQTPQPQKKSKAAVIPKPPATAPAKTGGGSATAGGVSHDEMLAAMQKYLKEHGPTTLAILGGSVTRPSKSTKLKTVVLNRKDIFEFDSEKQEVSLKK